METILCIRCPMGCRVQVNGVEDGDISKAVITGNRCARGKEHALQELTEPVRVLTALIHVEGSAVPLSVKTSAPIPKTMIWPCVRQLQKLSVRLPVSMGEVLIHNLWNTNADLIATRELT